MPNPLLIFLVLILLVWGGSQRLFEASSPETGNPDSNIGELNAKEEFAKVKEDIFYPKVITNLSQIDLDEDNTSV